MLRAGRPACVVLWWCGCGRGRAQEVSVATLRNEIFGNQVGHQDALHKKAQLLTLTSAVRLAFDTTSINPKTPSFEAFAADCAVVPVPTSLVDAGEVDTLARLFLPKAEGAANTK